MDDIWTRWKLMRGMLQPAGEILGFKIFVDDTLGPDEMVIRKPSGGCYTFRFTGNQEAE